MELAHGATLPCPAGRVHPTRAGLSSSDPA